jgi:hypothetical protein
MGKLTGVLGAVFIAILCAYSYFPLSARCAQSDFQAISWGPPFAAMLPLFLTVIAIASSLTVAIIYTKGGYKR